LDAGASLDRLTDRRYRLLIWINDVASAT